MAEAGRDIIHKIAATQAAGGYWPEGGVEDQKTAIYKFKLDGPKTTYLASAEVPGTVLNQFSMDESDGYFRIATSNGHVWKMCPSCGEVIDDEMEVKEVRPPHEK